jgi:hypothetical protein
MPKWSTPGIGEIHGEQGREIEEAALLSHDPGVFADAVYRICNKYERKTHLKTINKALPISGGASYVILIGRRLISLPRHTVLF